MNSSVSTSMPATNPRMPPAAFCNIENITLYYGQARHKVQSKETDVQNLPVAYKKGTKNEKLDVG